MSQSSAVTRLVGLIRPGGFVMITRLIRGVAPALSPQGFWSDRRAVTSIEYVIIAIIITIAIIGGLGSIGNHLATDFNSASSEL